MEYLITFLEGIITFISPCLLPMLPIYLVYFSGGGIHKKSSQTIVNAFGFISGFTILFVLLGAFASSVGMLLRTWQTQVNIVCGIVMILFGLNYTGLIRLPFINQTRKPDVQIKPSGWLSSCLFGIIFAIGWTPCVGTFLGSALMLASSKDSVTEGILMLLTYSLGLGIPFLLSAVLIDHLKGTFDAIKKHYRLINLICGILLIIAGLLMMSGLLTSMLYKLSL